MIICARIVDIVDQKVKRNYQFKNTHIPTLWMVIGNSEGVGDLKGQKF